MSDLSRKSRDFDITLHTATSVATTLDLRDMSGAIVSFGTMSTAATTLQMWVANASSGTYRRLRKADGTVVDVTLSPSTTDGAAYKLPDEVFAAEYLKLISGAAEANNTPGVVMLKS